MNRCSSIRNRLVLGGALLILTQGGIAEGPRPWTDSDRLSYALGLDLGLQMRRQAINLNPSIFGAGLIAGLAEDDSVMTPWDAQAIIGQLQQEMKRRRDEALAQAANRAAAGGGVPGDGHEAPEACEAGNDPSREPGDSGAAAASPGD